MRAPLTREQHIPAGAICIRDRASSAVAYVYATGRGDPAALVFAGKALKPTWRYRFPTMAAREQRVRGFFERIQNAERIQREKRAAKVAWQHPYKPGDIFGTCWGYEQTNREYYQCVEVRGKHLMIRQIRSGYIETQWLAGKATPLPGDFIGDAVRVLAQKGGFRAPQYRQWAMFMEPVMVGGVPTYGAEHVSSYA